MNFAAIAVAASFLLGLAIWAMLSGWLPPIWAESLGIFSSGVALFLAGIFSAGQG